jgi:hypothetical protein
MPDFNSLAPPIAVSNPNIASMGADYPLHLHKARGECCVVKNDVERDEKVAQGWPLPPKK